MITLLCFLHFLCLPSLILCNHCASIFFFPSLHFNSCPYSCSLLCEEAQKSSKLVPISSIEFKSQGCHVGFLLTFIVLWWVFVTSSLQIKMFFIRVYEAGGRQCPQEHSVLFFPQAPHPNSSKLSAKTWSCWSKTDIVPRLFNWTDLTHVWQFHLLCRLQ